MGTDSYVATGKHWDYVLFTCFNVCLCRMDADWIVLSYVFVCFAPGFVADMAAEAPPFLRSVQNKFFPFVLLSENRSN